VGRRVLPCAPEVTPLASPKSPPMPARRALGQYFTPPTVVGFCLDALAWLAPAPGAAARRLVDPACGDGSFLAAALERRLCLPVHTCGVDLDPELRGVWAQRGLAGPGGPWLDCADGLLADTARGQPLAEGSFDWVLGNPPYAGTGLKEASAQALEAIRGRYDLAASRPGAALRKLPLEVLFVERFWRLCRPGGWVAVVLPEGLLANARWRFVREWLLPRVTLHAVVALPRHTFRAGGITALTCVVVMHKTPAPPGHEVLLAQVDHVGLGGEPDELPEVLAKWQRGETETSGEPWR
jgi:type I restriction enzyme M protein